MIPSPRGVTTVLRPRTAAGGARERHARSRAPSSRPLPPPGRLALLGVAHADARVGEGRRVASGGACAQSGQRLERKLDSSPVLVLVVDADFARHVAPAHKVGSSDRAEALALRKVGAAVLSPGARPGLQA